MRIESLELFLSVAEHGSVSHTAKQHFISQQGVSSALKALEKELGTPLFTRGGPKLELTERGRAIASEAQRIVDSHRRMLAIASAPKDATTQNLRTVEILTTPFASAALEELFLDYEATTPGTRLRVTERDLSVLSTISLRDTHRHVARRSKDARHSQSSAACRAWTKRLAA